MSRLLGWLLPGLAVMTAAAMSNQAHSFVGQLIWAVAAWSLLGTFFIQKYPKTEPLRWIMRSLYKGEVVKIELEGK